MWNRLNTIALEPVFLLCTACAIFIQDTKYDWQCFSVQTCSSPYACLHIPLSVHVYISTGNSLEEF
jgi:hypothetical protein